MATTSRVRRAEILADHTKLVRRQRSGLSRLSSSRVSTRDDCTNTRETESDFMVRPETYTNKGRMDATRVDRKSLIWD